MAEGQILITAYPQSSYMGFGKDGKGQIFYETSILAPGALAAKDALVDPNGQYNQGTLLEDVRILKSEIKIDVRSGTAGDVVLIGMANGELSAAEIEGSLESTPLNSNDRGELEKALRAVFPIVQFTIGDDPASIDIVKTLRWTFNNPEGWSWWMYNPRTAAMTTGAEIILFAKHFGVWVQ